MLVCLSRVAFACFMVTLPLIIGVWARPTADDGCVDAWLGKVGEKVNVKWVFLQFLLSKKIRSEQNGTDILQVIPVDEQKIHFLHQNVLWPTLCFMSIFFLLFLIPNILYICAGGHLILKCCFYCFLLCVVLWLEHTPKSISLYVLSLFQYHR